MKNDEGRYYKIALLTILTISVIALTIIESLKYFDKRDGTGEGYFFTKDNRVVQYRGEITAEPLRTRTEQVNAMPRTTMQFYETKYNFGSVSEGSVLKHSFRFKNTGQNPLMIAKTDVSCGCTVPDYPVDPIAPGADGEITVAYNSAGKSGTQQKTINVHSNANPESITIAIEADVR